MAGNIVNWSPMSPQQAMLAPDLAAQQQQLQQQQAYAQALREQASEPIDTGGGRASVLAPITRIAQALIGAGMQRSVNQKGIALGQALRQRMGDQTGHWEGGDPAPSPPAAPVQTDPGSFAGRAADDGAPIVATPPPAPPQPSATASPPGGFTNPTAAAVAAAGQGAAPPAAAAPPASNAGVDRLAAVMRNLPPDPASSPAPDASPAAAPSAGGASPAPAPIGRHWVPGPLALSGTPRDLQLYLQNPDEYTKAQIAAAAPVEMARTVQQAQEALARGDMATASVLIQSIKKQNNIPLVAGRPNGTLNDADGNIVSVMPGAIEGAVPTIVNGKWTGGYTQAPGASNAIEAAARAKAVGGAAADLVPGIDPDTHQSTLVPKSQVLGGNGGKPFYTTLPAGAQPMLDSMGKASAKYVSDLQTAASTVPQQVSSLRQISRLASGATQFGPGSEAAVHVAKVLNGLGQVFGVQGSWNDRTITDHSLMTKFANNVAGAAAAGMGLNGSDARFNVAVESNPGGHMTNNAIKDVVPYVIGLRQAEAGHAAFAGRYAAQHPGPNVQSEVTTLWNQNYDPKVYTMMERGPQAFSQYVHSLPPAQAATLLSKYRWLKQNGALPQ